METIKVNSSNVQSLEYDEDNQALYVGYKNGGQYMYIGVLKNVWAILQKAESVGTALHKTVLSDEKLVVVNMQLFDMSNLLRQIKGLKVLITQMGKSPTNAQMEKLMSFSGVVLAKKKETKTVDEKTVRKRRVKVTDSNSNPRSRM